MLSDVPNYWDVFGYTNASWTLKADLICSYACRTIQHMEVTVRVRVRVPSSTLRLGLGLALGLGVGGDDFFLT